MVNISYQKYYRYDELSDLMKAFQEEYPHLVRIESIGKSYEGREIWLARVTHFERGSDEEKPALWVDGNLHATEISPSSACLYLMDYLCRGYGHDPDITFCLDSRAFYICPRLCPDGAEWALADRPKIVRSSTRPYPFDEEPFDGLKVEDLDGDGKILMMRLPDSNGSWKVHPEEPRLMVRREPTERGGKYYRLLPEGSLENYKEGEIKVQPKKQTLDLNRNFPINWRGEKDQEGAGAYPTSEPEVRSVVDFMVSRKNITGAISFHTFAGLLLRPYSDHNDEAFPAEDLWTYQTIGQKGTDITGYPHASVFHEFKYHPKEIITGCFDDWAYENLGVFAWTVEIWSPQRQAGIEKYKYIDWYRDHPIEDDLKLLRWSDEVLEGKGYIDWYSFDHPQLGPVELGGWDWIYCFRNPPLPLLEKEISLFPQWVLWHLLISPKLEFLEASATPLGEGLYRVRFGVHNTGWLPSYVTKKGLEKKLSRGVVFEIHLPCQGRLVGDLPRREKDHLEGRAYKPSSPVGWNVWNKGDETEDRSWAEWIVEAPAGTTVELTARQERSGVVRTMLTLE